MSKHISPSFNTSSFHCPHCGVFAEQTWSIYTDSYFKMVQANGQTSLSSYRLENILTAKCKHCRQISIWLSDKMVYPLTGNIEMANEDLPEDIKNDYNEARNIVNISPKGAAALLRLSVQKLCIHLGEKGKNINDDIKSLVEKGLPIHVQQALDILRVTGNNAVHPGTIDLNDKTENALALFGFVNFLCNHFITQPKIIAGFYNNLPEKDRTNIAKRDS